MVSDVERYPEFINLLSGLRITKRLSETEFEAEAIVAYKMISETFRSHITANREDLTIQVKKADKSGVVKSLDNSWKFFPLKDGSSLVDVQVSVALKAKPLEFLLRDKFGKASVHIVNLFEKRASQNVPMVGELDYDFKPEMMALGLDPSK